MSKEGKPTLQALASVLSTHHKNTDMSDIHLLVKRRLAALHLGEKLMLMLMLMLMLLSTLVRSSNLSIISRQRRRPARSGGALESFEQTSVFKAEQRQRLHH